MIGDRLTGIARRLLRDDSFALIAAPAIADLQYEAPMATRLRLAGHAVAVTVTIARVACTDVAADLGLVPGAQEGAWPPAATFWRLLAICSAYYGFLLWFLVGLSTSSVSLLRFFATADLASTVAVTGVVAAASLVTAVSLCLPERRRTPASDDTP